MKAIVFLFFVSAVSGAILSDYDTANRNSNPNPKDSKSKLLIWAEAAYRWTARLNCTADSAFLCAQTCRMTKQLKQRDYRIYGTEPMVGQKYGVVFPDSDTKHKTFHDNVLVLDPFPASRFGHPILVFYVDVNVNTSVCDAAKGFMIDDSTCLQTGSRTLNTKNSYNFISRILFMKNFNCGEIVFPPLVYLQSELPVQTNDQLECLYLEGFYQNCPKLRSKSETSYVPCHRLRTNRDCGFLENSLRSRCSTSRTCDHAVLLSGGWNRQLSDVESFNNIFNMKQLLLRHGFVENNIEIFFANGEQKDPPEEPEKDGLDDVVVPPIPQTYYSSSLKTSMRNHIRTLCDSELCSDSLFIYMNSPTTSDGSSLLWDTYDDGMYEEREIYTPRELMRDVAHCAANRVIIMADQSYGKELVTAAEARFVSLSNVLIFTSSEEFNHLPNKDRLTNYMLRYQHRDICLDRFKDTFYQTHKSAIFIGSKSNLLNSTLVGGPCLETETFLNDPQTEQYRGCSLSPVM